jgi:hypothetical protein
MTHPLIIGGTTVRTNETGLVSLNDIYAAAQADGQAAGKLDPKEWGRVPRQKTSGSSGKVSVSGGPGRDFIDFVASNLNADAARIYKAVRGAGGGTFAHWQIALAYAKYLSPALHAQVNETYMRAKSGDVTLADEIADKATPEQQEWLATRINGKVARRRFTGMLQAHGVEGRGYADCTNEIYKPIVGGKADEIRQLRNLKKGASIRDVLPLKQLLAVGLAECLAAEKIESENARGNTRCITACSRASSNVAAMLLRA